MQMLALGSLAACPSTTALQNSQCESCCVALLSAEPVHTACTHSMYMYTYDMLCVLLQLFAASS